MFAAKYRSLSSRSCLTIVVVEEEVVRHAVATLDVTWIVLVVLVSRVDRAEEGRSVGASPS